MQLFGLIVMNVLTLVNNERGLPPVCRPASSFAFQSLHLRSPCWPDSLPLLSVYTPPSLCSFVYLWRGSGFDIRGDWRPLALAERCKEGAVDGQLRRWRWWQKYQRGRTTKRRNEMLGWMTLNANHRWQSAMLILQHTVNCTSVTTIKASELGLPRSVYGCRLLIKLASLSW